MKKSIISLSILLYAGLAGAQPLSVEELAAQIKADEASVARQPENDTEHQKALHNREMLAAMKESADALDKERQEAAAKAAEAAEAAAQAAEAAKYPKTYDEAKAWMIKHFEIPDNAKILSFDTVGTPVRWAGISWKVTAITRISGAGSGLGMHSVGPDQVYVEHLYHSRGYDFSNQTLTDQSDY
jgi:hypothetical protein